jgi:circadian clock protein KaiC
MAETPRGISSRSLDPSAPARAALEFLRGAIRESAWSKPPLAPPLAVEDVLEILDRIDPDSGPQKGCDMDGNPRAATGIAGLDDVLAGGLPMRRLYLLQGLPGVGKTTLGLQFLMEGARRGERVLYITLSETEEEIRQVAASHGWSLENVDLHELSSMDRLLKADDENTLYAPADVELKETVKILLEEVERTRPTRVVFDSLSEIRLLAQSESRYRREILLLKQFFIGRNCTVLLLDDHAPGAEQQVASLVHGVLQLEHVDRDYGGDRRRLRVAKMRGAVFRSGYHDFTVRTGGLEVFPRLVAAEHPAKATGDQLRSGLAGLDHLLGGGLDRGTATLLVGPAGTGKSAVATQLAVAAAERGEIAALFLFDERPSTLHARSRGLGLELERHVETGRVLMTVVDPAELAPDEFVARVRHVVEDKGAKVVGIDSINGYFLAMPGDRFLTLQMHELLSYLSARGVVTIMTMAQAGIVGAMNTPLDVSYLSDNVVLFRFFENAGQVRKAISVLKRRAGPHEHAIRELRFGPGLIVGEPLAEFSGILTGVPTYHGKAAPPDRGLDGQDAR